MSPHEPRLEQVREVLARKRPSTGRHRAESAVTARWLRALRGQSRAAAGSTRIGRPAS